MLNEATGRTLSLDGTSAIPHYTQARPLRALETGRMRRVGDDRERTVDVRLVIAAQHDPAALVAQGRWRQDLCFRVAGLVVQLPPLRQRTQDLECLARSLSRSHESSTWSDRQGDALRQYDWPGSIRELRALVGRSALLAEDDLITPEQIVEAARSALGTDLRTQECRRLASVVSAHIQRVLNECGGSVDEAASVLGLSRSQVYRKLKRFYQD